MSTKEEIILTGCPFDCGGTGLLYVHKKDGVAVDIKTEGKSPDGSRPPLPGCVRCLNELRKVNDPTRLRNPLKRVGVRGKGKFESISWDEALDTVAKKLKETKKHYGPESILTITTEATLTVSLHQTRGLNKRFLCMFGGCTEIIGHHSCHSYDVMSCLTYGAPHGLASHHPWSDCLNANLIILWGSDLFISRRGTTCRYWLARAQEAGIKIIVVDPKRGRTAKFADRWIPIKPGTDTAMLLAMAYVIIDNGLHDEKFLEERTKGFEVWRDYLFGVEDGIPKTPKWAEKKTGVPADVIEELAIEYAKSRPSILFPGWAPARTYNGEQFARAVMMLPIITKNFGIKGGNPASCNFGCGYLIPNQIPRPAIPPREPIKGAWEIPPNSTGIYIPIFTWPDHVLKGKAGGYPSDIRLAYAGGGNLLNQQGDVNKTVQALNKLDFIVVHDTFLTPTARYADIVLPVCSFLERNDVTEDWCNYDSYYIYCHKAIEPIPGCKTDFEIYTLLAERLGFADEFNPKRHLPNYGEEAWLREFVEAANRPGLDYDSFKEEGVYYFTQPELIPFREQIEDGEPFPTPCGKIEIYCDALAAANNPLVPPIPKWIDIPEGLGGPEDPMMKEYPFQLISPPNWYRHNSSFSNLNLHKREERPWVIINTEDAKERGIKQEDKLQVYNQRGKVIVYAEVSDDLIKGTVAIEQGRWYTPNEEGICTNGSVNVLTCGEPTPFVKGPTQNTARVQITKVL